MMMDSFIVCWGIHHWGSLQCLWMPQPQLCRKLQLCRKCSEPVLSAATSTVHFFSVWCFQCLTSRGLMQGINCLACRTYVIARRSSDMVICPICMCLTVYEFFLSFCLIFVYSSQFHFYFESCTHCNIFDIYLLYNMNYVKYLLLCMKLLSYLFCNMFGSVLECYELTGVRLLWTRRALANKAKNKACVKLIWAF